MDDFNASLKIATSGLRAQSFRMKVVTQNIANAESTADNPNSDPYQRKLVRFKDFVSRPLNAQLVRAEGGRRDTSPFILKYEPGHPAADGKGYVKYPNVNPLIELGDMRESQISYQANLNIITTTRQMVSSTLELLKA